MDIKGAVKYAWNYAKSFITNDSVDRLPGANVYSVSMPDLAALWGQYSDSNLTVLYHEIPEVYTPVHHIASRVATGNWQLKKLSDDSVVFDNKYMTKILSQPNPLQNFQELVYQKEAYELITGKNFLYANVHDSLPVNYRTLSTLLNLPADNVQIQTAPVLKMLSATVIEDIIQYFITADGSNGLNKIPPSKVMYTKHASLYAQDLNIRGRSPLLSAQKPVSNLIAVYEARNVIYTKRGALGFLVSKVQDAGGMVPLTSTEKKETQDDYNQSYGLTGKKSPIAISRFPFEFVKVAATIAELEPFKETEADCAAIFAVYNVPRELMPRTEGATYENQSAAEKSLYENVVIPRANNLAQSLTNFLKLNDAGFYLDVDFSHIKVLQENLKEKSEVNWKNNETARVRFLNGIITLNDWRVSCKLEAVKNKFYDRLIYDMSPEELVKVEQILKLSKNGTATANQGADPQQQQDGK